MKPKSRKEILETCQNNFWDYSPQTRFLIFVSIILSAISWATYICQYIYPTSCGIIYGDIVGWNIVWRIGLALILYGVLRDANLIFISIGGYAVCRDEGWEVEDFAVAWMDMYEVYNTDDNSENKFS